MSKNATTTKTKTIKRGWMQSRRGKRKWDNGAVNARHGLIWRDKLGFNLGRGKVKGNKLRCVCFETREMQTVIPM